MSCLFSEEPWCSSQHQRVLALLPVHEDMVVLVAFLWVCVLALAADILAPLSGPRHWHMSQDTALQSGCSGLLGAPVSLLCVPFIRPSKKSSQTCVAHQLVLPWPSFVTPVFFLLLFLFYNWPILGTVFYPLLMEVVLKKPCPFLFFLYCPTAMKNWMCVLLLRTGIWSVCLKVCWTQCLSSACMERKEKSKSPV